MDAKHTVVPEMVEAIRSKVEIPRPLYKQRDIVSRLIFGMSYANALTAEIERKLPAPEIDELRAEDMRSVYGDWIVTLVDVARALIVKAASQKKTHFVIGDYVLVTNNGFNLYEVMREYRQANPTASASKFVDYLIGRGEVEEVEEHPGFAFKYIW